MNLRKFRGGGRIHVTFDRFYSKGKSQDFFISTRGRLGNEWKVKV